MPQETRKLAAIMFTDIVGYSALMSKDEKLALKVISRNREIHKSAIQRYNGEFIKETGDGTLSIFKTSSDAVDCALDIREKCCLESDFSIRIGIHIGEIVIIDNDVFGDGVNIASRIESYGGSGGIFISDRIFEDIKNKSGYQADYLGEKKLKNIDHPVKIYQLKEKSEVTQDSSGRSGKVISRIKKQKYPLIVFMLIVIAGLAIFYWISSKGSKKPDEHLIAVANFENRTGDASLDPVGRMAADWITEGIASTGLTSVVPSIVLESIANENTRSDIRELAKKSHASTIITGEFFRSGPNLQFHTNIIDAKSGKTLSPIEHTEGPADDPAKAIEILIQKIMSALAVHFDQQFLVFSDRRLNPPLFEAYQEFLKGQKLYYAIDLIEAREHFYHAYKTDSNFLLPVIWAIASSWGLEENAQADSLEKIIAGKKNRLTPGEKYLLQYVNAWYIDGDWEMVYQSTIQVAKYNQLFKYEEGRSALFSNRLEEAVDKSLEVGPDTLLFKAMYWYVLTTAYHLLGEHQKEIKAARGGREKYPELNQTLWYELRALAALGHLPEIKTKFNEIRNKPVNISASGSDAYYYGIPGKLMTRTALELRAHGFLEGYRWAANEALDWFDRQPDTSYRFELGQACYAAEEWEKAYWIFIELLKKDTANSDYLGYLGCISARLGNPEQRDEYSHKIASKDNYRQYGNNQYWLARIEANTGNKEKAVQDIHDALQSGFLIVDLHAVMDFESLQDYPPFLEIIKPKE